MIVRACGLGLVLVVTSLLSGCGGTGKPAIQIEAQDQASLIETAEPIRLSSA